MSLEKVQQIKNNQLLRTRQTKETAAQSIQPTLNNFLQQKSMDNLFSLPKTISQAIQNPPNPKTYEPTEQGIKDTVTIGEDALDTAAIGEGEDVGESLGTAGADVVADGGGDPITDVIGGLLALGGAIAAGVSSKPKAEVLPIEPTIEQQQQTQAEEI